MRVLRLAVLSSIVLAAVAAGRIGLAHATHGENEFAGQWRTNIGEVTFVVVSDSSGKSALTTMPASPAGSLRSTTPPTTATSRTRTIANCFRIAPPLTVTEDEIGTAVEILDASLTAVLAGDASVVSG